MLRILLLCGFLPLPALGAQVADSTVVLPPLTVTAARLPVSTLEAPVRTQVLDRRAIFESGSTTVADLLRQRASLYVRHYTGGLSTLSQRGGTASQTLILLDGHRIASPQLGQLDLSLLPTILLDDVEITSGAGGALFGTDAVGGVVNLHTAPSAHLLSVRVGTGAWGRRNAAARASTQFGRLIGSVAGEVDRFTGNYPYWNSGVFPPRYTRREGGDRLKRSLYGSLTWAGADSEWRLSTWYNDSERGLPTIYSTLPKQERQWDEHLRLWTHGKRSRTWGSFKASSLVQFGALRYLNPQLRLDNTGRSFISTTQLNLELMPIRDWRFGAGIEAGYGQADHPSLRQENAERHFAAYAHAIRRWRRFAVYPALRLDYYVRPRTVRPVSPRLGLNVRLMRGIHLKGSVARAFRMPTFNDRFWQPGGNPDLRPERGWSYDAGLIWARGMFQAELTAFTFRLRDQIVWQPLAAGYWAPLNVSRIATRGLEATVEFQKPLAIHMHTGGGVVWTRVEQHSDSFLRLIPRQEVKSNAHIRWRFVSVRATAHYTGARAVTPVTQSDAILLLHVQMGVYVGPLSVGIYGENLLNVCYEYLPANPMPPRQARLDLTLTIR